MLRLQFSHSALAALILVAGIVSASAAASAAGPASAAGELAVPPAVQAALTAYCVNCHGVSGKGNVRLVGLDSFKLNEWLDTLNKVQDQLFYKMMPPPSADQPGEKELQTLSDWVRAELRRHGASKLDDRLPYPDSGNYVDHATLFDGSVRSKPFTPARRWLVSPQIFEQRVLDVFGLEGQERQQLKRNVLPWVTNPFVLPDHPGVRYYDLHSLDGGHLLVMLANAEWIATKQLHAARLKAGQVITQTSENPRDKWFPKTTPAAFETIVAKKAPPTDGEIRAAIQTQFHSVLKRPPTDSELAYYLPFARDAIALGGNTEGLRQVLKAVLLESEFVYRLEFGAGQPDEYGRLLLAPREAAYAIGYALGDRGPDAALLQAAATGRLATRDDFRREVLRLLKDPTHYAGVVDDSLGGGLTTLATHPVLVRFFREFFGYATAHKVFKDVKRADGFYTNADRGSTGTAGALINEADKLVNAILVDDTAVFETLLTTNRFFVYHNMDNEKGTAQIEKWRHCYEALKHTNWKNDPDAVIQEHAELIKQAFGPTVTGKSKARHDSSLVRLMTHFDQTFGQGRTPFTVLPWAHGNRYRYSTLYNLSKTPGLDGKYDRDSTFDYQPVQPFPVPHRKGILTHPAWLIAFSSNTHSDPIRRGRWIREKLLAGIVPDVPITVDAKIPDDPDKTLRERVHSATRSAACYKCHGRMNDLGYPFEQFDDFGRFRTDEQLEHPDNVIRAGDAKTADVFKTKPIDPTGFLTGTGDPRLDGRVQDASDLIDRLARSERVRQSIIRHAFRFFLGRNERPSDAQTLLEADRAYMASGGSFRAVVVSLLTSDSFLYRRPARP